MWLCLSKLSMCTVCTTYLWTVHAYVNMTGQLQFLCVLDVLCRRVNGINLLVFINSFITDWSIFLTSESDTCSSPVLLCSAYFLSSTKWRKILNFFSFKGKESDLQWLRWRGKGPNLVGPICLVTQLISMVWWYPSIACFTVARSDHTELIYQLGILCLA